MRSITTTPDRLVEDVKRLFYVPCPDAICDGSGMVANEMTRKEEKCPHVKDSWAVEPKEV